MSPAILAFSISDGLPFPGAQVPVIDSPDCLSVKIVILDLPSGNTYHLPARGVLSAKTYDEIGSTISVVNSTLTTKFFFILFLL